VLTPLHWVHLRAGAVAANWATPTAVQIRPRSSCVPV